MKQLIFSRLKHPPVQFVLLILGYALLYHWFTMLFMPITGAHIWRQSDSLSIVQNYFYDHQSFFEPRTSDYRHNFTDITLTEFPILYYLTAKIWLITGEQIGVLRLLHLICLLLGMWGLYRIMLLYVDSVWLRLSAIGLVLASPALAHYAPGFLPNTAALGFVFYSFYHFHNVYRNPGQIRSFVQGLFWLIFACLLKITMLYAWVVVLVFLLIRRRSFDTTKRFLVLLGLLFLALLPIWSWVNYLEVYNRESASLALYKTFSVFGQSWEQITAVWDQGIKDHLLQLEVSWFWYLFLVLIIWNVFHLLRQRHWQLFLLHILLGGSSLVYLLLFYFSFKDHDYYLLDFIPFIALQVITAAYYLNGYNWRFKGVSVLTVLLFVSVRTSADVVSRNLDVTRGIAKQQSRFVDERALGFHAWFRWDSSHFWGLKKYRPVLAEMGVNRQTPVLCMPDQSPNILLYYLNLRGQSNFYWGSDYAHLDEILHTAKQEGYRYFIQYKLRDARLDSAVLQLAIKPLWQDSILAVYRLKEMP